MQNYANATIEGFVAQDPVTRETKTGKTVCTFSLAVNHYNKADSEPRVSYIDVETWDSLAKLCSGSVAKGKRLMVIGTLRQDRWDGKDGKAQSKIKIIGNEVRFLEKHKPGIDEKEEVTTAKSA